MTATMIVANQDKLYHTFTLMSYWWLETSDNKHNLPLYRKTHEDPISRPRVEKFCSEITKYRDSNAEMIDDS